jgi:hypothetical protein
MKKVGKQRTRSVGLRISEGLRKRLAEAAKRHGTSLNTEMERRLEQSFTAMTSENFHLFVEWSDDQWKQLLKDRDEEIDRLKEKLK